jgi:hypothetical protein
MSAPERLGLLAVAILDGGTPLYGKIFPPTSCGPRAAGRRVVVGKTRP